MMTRPTSPLARIVRSDTGIAGNYTHAAKFVTGAEPIETFGTVLKWYALHRSQLPIPGTIARLARARLTAAPLAARGLGFAVLHRCEQDFYFLIVCTWRNSNELWQSVFYKDGDAMQDFEPFAREDIHKPMLCIWELVPVWHEQQAWLRFLASARDLPAARAWLNDCYCGPA